MSTERAGVVEKRPTPGSPEDRINAPGWRDRLRDQAVVPWEGEDKIHTRRQASRKGWHRVLCARLDRDEGQTLNDLQGSLGWFYLKLTRNEATCVVDSAKAAELITLEHEHAADGSTIPPEERRWILTDDGKKRIGTVDPRGGGAGDLLGRIVPTAGETYAKMKAAIGIAGFVGVGLLAGNVAVQSGSLGAWILLICGVWLFFALLTYSAVSDERVLSSMVRSWPRMHDYRPARCRFELTTLRTPLPYGVLAAATIIGALCICWVLHDHDKLSDGAWNAAKIIAISLAAVGVGVYRLLGIRAAGLRSAYVDEYQRRLEA